MSKHKWSNVKGNVYIDVFVDLDYKWYSDEKEVPVSTIVKPGEYELEIKFSSSGYWDSGNPYGRIDTCYPPEGDEERTLDEACLAGMEDSLPKDVQEKLFEHFYKEVSEQEIDEYANDPDDYDWLADD